MRGSYTVALVGFSQQEAWTLELSLRQAARHAPGYRLQDEVMDAQILIVNADNPQALHLVSHAKLPGRVMLIGHTDGGTGWPLQHKSAKPAAVLAELDRIVGIQPVVPGTVAGKDRTIDGRRSPTQVPPSSSMESGFPSTEFHPMAALAPMVSTANRRRRSRDSEFQPTRPMRTADLAPPPLAAAVSLAQPVPRPTRLAVSVQRPGAIRTTDLSGLYDLPPTPEAPEPPRGDVLLVAESMVEGRTLLKRFKKYGLSVDWSRESEQALAMIGAHSYRMVVIDRLSGQPDAFQVCRVAKQKKHVGRSPVVFMLAAIAGSMDRMKAGLAGCDAYLSRSIGEADLYKLLAQHRLVNLDAFARTNIGV
jgi:CheY-like chemotaxis protein